MVLSKRAWTSSVCFFKGLTNEEMNYGMRQRLITDDDLLKNEHGRRHEA